MKIFNEAEKKSLQAVYDKVCAGLIKQGRKSYGRSKTFFQGKGCLYRYQNGDTVLSCAIGQLISDEQIEKYKIEEGDNPFTFDNELMAELLPGVNLYEGRSFLKDLQDCHDTASKSQFVTDFIDKANRFARMYGLKIIQQEYIIQSTIKDTDE